MDNDIGILAKANGRSNVQPWEKSLLLAPPPDKNQSNGSHINLQLGTLTLKHLELRHLMRKHCEKRHVMLNSSLKLATGTAKLRHIMLNCATAYA